MEKGNEQRDHEIRGSLLSHSCMLAFFFLLSRLVRIHVCLIILFLLALSGKQDDRKKKKDTKKKKRKKKLSKTHRPPPS